MLRRKIFKKILIYYEKKVQLVFKKMRIFVKNARFLLETLEFTVESQFKTESLKQGKLTHNSYSVEYLKTLVP